MSNINFSRDSVNKNSFHLVGIQEKNGEKGIAGYHGGVSGIIGWISAKILRNSVPVKSENKGYYYLKCESLKKWRQSVAANDPLPKDIHSQKEVEAMLQGIIGTPKEEEGLVKEKNNGKKEIKQVSSQKEAKLQEIIGTTTPKEDNQEIQKESRSETQTQVTESKTTTVKKGIEKTNPVYTLRMALLSDYGNEVVKKNVNNIGKSFKEQDQDDLNFEMYSFYRNSKFSAITELANTYLKNEEYDKLDMMVKAFESIDSRIKNSGTGIEDKMPGKFIEEYKTKYTAEQAKPKEVVVTTKKILQEGTPNKFSETIDNFNARIVKIRNSLESWDSRFNPLEFNFDIIQYVTNVDDVEPLIRLTKHFKDNKDEIKANRMVTSLIEAQKILKEEKKLNKINAYLQQIGQLPVKMETKEENRAGPTEKDPKKILMGGTLKEDLRSFPNMLSNNADKIIEEINKDSTKFDQDKLDPKLNQFIDDIIDVEPFIDLCKNYVNLKQHDQVGRLETFIKNYSRPYRRR